MKKYSERVCRKFVLGLVWGVPMALLMYLLDVKLTWQLAVVLYAAILLDEIIAERT